MDISNIVALLLGGIGFIISIVSFFLTPILNLKSKRLEKRLEYRFVLFQKILELWELSHQTEGKGIDVNPLMKEINKLIQLYGYNSEIKSFKELGDSYNYYIHNQNEANRQNLLSEFGNFFSISFNTYRKEIVLEKLEIIKNDKII